MSILNYTRRQEVKAISYVLRSVTWFLAMTFLFITARLWHLQINLGGRLAEHSNKNYLKKQNTPAPRGLIQDHTGALLVGNYLSNNATLSLQHVQDLKTTSRALAKILNLEPSALLKRIQKLKRSTPSFKNLVIKKHLSLDEIRQLQQLRAIEPAIGVQNFISRSYSLGPVGAQLFGYIGSPTKEEIQAYKIDTQDYLGKTGLERFWENDLRGTKGLDIIEVDVYGRRIPSRNLNSTLHFRSKKATPGNNLVLTLDKNLQQAAFKAFMRKDKLYPRRGSFVMLKTTGEILAWVSTPSYDPNSIVQGITHEDWRDLASNDFHPLSNKVIHSHFPPGSTIKPLVAIAALQERIITPYEKIASPGQFRYGRRTYHDHKKSGHGNINIYEAIARSSNVYFYKLGARIGIDLLSAYAGLFNLGEPTGIKLYGEAPGLFPNKRWKRKNLKEKWQGGETLSQAIGQGFVLTTTLQLALLYQAIANEGMMYKPYLVKKVTTPSGDVKTAFRPQLVRDITDPSQGWPHIDAQNFKVIKKALLEVVHSPNGTARWWRLPRHTMAGKTGTSQVRSFSSAGLFEKCENKALDRRHHGIFAAFAPVEKPEVVAVAMVEHGCHGSVAAAPVVRDAFEAYFNPPTNP